MHFRTFSINEHDSATVLHLHFEYLVKKVQSHPLGLKTKKELGMIIENMHFDSRFTMFLHCFCFI